MAEPRFGYFRGRWPLLAVFLIAAVVVACRGGDEAGPTPDTSPTVTPVAEATPTLAATLTPTPLPSPTATNVPPTIPPPSPTQLQSFAPRISCPGRTHQHLNIELLAAQPGMEDAVITEVDEHTIRVEVDGIDVVVRGWLKVMGFHGDLTNDQLDQISIAVDAVVSEC